LSFSFEVVHAAFEYGLDTGVGDVFIEPGAAALRVPHLAQDPAVRRADGLYGEDGAVRVIADVHRGLALEVHVLRHEPAGALQLGKKRLRADEAALAVRDGDGVYVAHAAAGQPGAERRGNAGAHKHTLVPAYGVVGEGGAIFVRL